jgi:AcrR family transcriptional regulator
MTAVRRATTAPRKRYHHGDLPNAIRVTAATLIAERGHPGFTLRELATCIGVAHAAVYAHYASKGELLRALAIGGLRDLEAAQAACVAGCRDPLQALVLLGDAYLEFARREPGLYRLIFATDLADSEASSVADARDLAARRMLDTIELAQRRKLIVERPPEVVAFALWSTVHGLAHLVISRHIGEFPSAARDEEGTLRFAILSAIRGVATASGRRRALAIERGA